MFEPNYLNIEYFFNLVLLFFQYVASMLGALLNTAASADLAAARIILWGLSFVIAAAIVYTLIRHNRVVRGNEARYGELQVELIDKRSLEDRNVAWQRILDHLDSPNESDWRLAIIEADTVLKEVLDKSGFVGDTIGEKLKGLEKGDIASLSAAWEAHKVRNRIAHEGSEFRLNKREAERVIDLYRQVFEELHYI